MEVTKVQWFPIGEFHCCLCGFTVRYGPPAYTMSEDAARETFDNHHCNQQKDTTMGVLRGALYAILLSIPLWLIIIGSIWLVVHR